MDWAVEEWAGKGLGAALLDHLEDEPDLDPNNPTLLADLAVDRRPAIEQRLVAFTEGEGREVMR